MTEILINEPLDREDFFQFLNVPEIDLLNQKGQPYKYSTT